MKQIHKEHKHLADDVHERTIHRFRCGAEETTYDSTKKTTNNSTVRWKCVTCPDCLKHDKETTK